MRRLQPVLNDLIGDFQSAFVSGRSINENCITAHEMLNFLKRKKERKSILNNPKP